jgi:hypothetical protein
MRVLGVVVRDIKCIKQKKRLIAPPPPNKKKKKKKKKEDCPSHQTDCSIYCFFCVSIDFSLSGSSRRCGFYASSRSIQCRKKDFT